jgi:hypothetical protein
MSRLLEDIITEAIAGLIQEGHRHIKRVQADSFGHHETDDDYLYHVTSTEHVPSIKAHGLNPNKTPTVSNYANHSKGKLFLTDRSGVSYWKSRIEDHLFHNSDNPRQVAVFRVHKSHVKGLQRDEVGSSDSGRNAYYTETPIRRK